MRAVSHSEDLLVLDLSKQMVKSSDEVVTEEPEDMDQIFRPVCSKSESHFLSRGALNDLMSDLKKRKLNLVQGYRNGIFSERR